MSSKLSKPIFVLGIVVLMAIIPAYNWLQRQSLAKSPNPIHTALPTFTIKPKDWPLTVKDTVDIGQIPASSLLLIDENTGTILAQRNANQPRPIASITKIMTAALVLELAQPESRVTIPKGALANLPADSAVMGASAGEQYTIKELLYGLLLPSGNDAAQALAFAVAGNQSDFVTLMNAKAKQLGLKNTHFTNPSGLDDTGHYSSATDIAILTHYAQSFPLFDTIVNTKQKTLAYTLQHKYLDLVNANDFIRLYPGATGVKPGNTGDAGNCLVATATRDGHQLLGVLLDTPGRNTNMAKLFDLGFNSY